MAAPAPAPADAAAERREISRQILKQPNDRLVFNHITARHPDHIWQMDLLDMSNVGTYNANFKWIFTLIDVYSRFVYAIPLKTKDGAIEAFRNLLQRISPRHPEFLTSDRDSVFLSQPFTQLCQNHGITQVYTEAGDHRPLGVVDRFHETLRRKFIGVLSAVHGTNRWIDDLDEFIEEYNSHPHKTLRDRGGHRISPREVMENGRRVFKYKYSYKLVPKDKLPKLEDHVRVKLPVSHFDKRSTTQRWSSEVYRVVGVDSMGVPKYQLQDLATQRIMPKQYRGDALQIIPRVKKDEEKDERPPPAPRADAQGERKQAIRERRRIQTLRREDVDERNIVRGERKKKRSSKLDDFVT